ncbi:DnaJ subfamily B member 9 [Folsomia candida]|uniref:DnaJ homolog subfamily B member 9 n=1 Tax=Folsomia candida TaxID=158441 RepID=A0A226D045_FOLCA|nr:DnaJ subfamily B member 9 [Folsomia candida]
MEVKNALSLINGVMFLLLLTELVLAEVKKRDYYEILGVKRTAKDREIKKAFRKLAKRKKYDQFGHDTFSSGGGGGGGGGGFHFNFDDFFKGFDFPGFGGGGGDEGFHYSFGGGGHSQQQKRQENQQRGGGGFFTFEDFFNDEDEGFGGFDAHSFGGGDSFFGTHFGGGGGHHHDGHDHGHHHQQQQAFARFGGHPNANSGNKCRTVTQKVGNMITTYTQCS